VRRDIFRDSFLHFSLMRRSATLSRPWFPKPEGPSGAPPLLNQHRTVFTRVNAPNKGKQLHHKTHPYLTNLGFAQEVQLRRDPYSSQEGDRTKLVEKKTLLYSVFNIVGRVLILEIGFTPIAFERHNIWPHPSIILSPALTISGPSDITLLW